MLRDSAELAGPLADRGLDGYLIDADGANSDQRYLSGFDAPDPFASLFRPGEGVSLLVSSLEYGRARAESDAAEVARLADYDYRAKVVDLGREAAHTAAIAEFLADRDVESVAVPTRFPVGTADGLRERGVTVESDPDDLVTQVRARKTDAEVEHVRATQRANERAMAVAEDLLREATVEGGVLHHEGEPLTSERVTAEIEVALVREGCALSETIVACGADAADPHDRGSGPLRAGETVVVDIFPRDKESGYHADMTRTFVVGEASDEARAFYEATEAAMDVAFDAIEPGTTGEAVHEAVSTAYEERGYPTLRSDETTETGFIHGTGHGVGLDVHELPRLADGGEELKPGHIVTVEPGLYDPNVGGVRIEDFVVVTEDGYENLTEYPKRFEI